jgi:glycosyltransferase involved in cell wall biosynthesis
MSNSPQFPEVGVIALVADRWSQEWMSRHQILTRLAKYFHVVWVNPAPDWQQALSRPKEDRKDSVGFPPGFHIYEADFWLPNFYRPRVLADFAFRKRLERARDVLVQKGCRKFVLYIWRPEFHMSLDAIRFDLSCYHIVDEYSFCEVESPNSRDELKLLERADQIFVHTQALLEKKGQLRRNIAVVPNGVSFVEFSTPVPEPASLATIPHPRVGYAGYLKKTLDWNLLLSLSARKVEYSFVFVGARIHHEQLAPVLQELSSRPNVHFLGPVTASQMPQYAQHFDVCIMPYVLNSYTNYIYPLKLHEYLASGRPVVASPIRLLKEFEGTIQLCGNSEQWSAAISTALQPEANSAEARKVRQEIAKKHDWDTIVRGIVRVFCRKLGLQYEQLMDQALLPG